MRRFLPLLLLLLVLVPVARAEAVTIRDIIELTRAGVSEEILLALIEIDDHVHTVDRAALDQLRAANVSDKVIVALIKSGRTPVPEAPPPAPAPAFPEQPMVEDPAPQPQVVVVQPAPQVVHEVAVPVYIPFAVSTGKVRHRHFDSFVDVPNTFPSQPPMRWRTDTKPSRSSKPVYWGFGGELRPDAWKPAGHESGKKSKGGKRN